MVGCFRIIITLVTLFMVRKFTLFQENYGFWNLFVPESLNLVDCINTSCLSPDEKAELLRVSVRWPHQRLKLKRLTLILDKLTWLQTTLKPTNHGYCAMNSVTTAKRLGCKHQELAEMVKLLKRLGIIEVNPKYAKERFPRSYRFSPTYRGRRARLVDPAFLVSARWAQKEQCEVNPQGPLEEWLHECCLNVSFDLPRSALTAVIDLAIADEKDAEKLLAKRAHAVMGMDAVLADSALKRSSRVCGWHFGRGDDQGRISSTITGLKRELRPHLLLYGEKTTEIDQRASQPFLLLKLYESVESPAAKAEVAAFYALWSNDFYSDIGRMSGISIDRDTLKEVVIEGVLNGKVTNSGTIRAKSKERREQIRAIVNVFEGQFPILWGEIVKLKTIEGYLRAKRGPKGMHTQYARHQQRLEARIFIDKIAQRLKSQNIVCYTVHDCIGVRETDLEATKVIMLEEIQASIGFVPTLSTK